MKIFLAALEAGDCTSFIEKKLIENGFWSYFHMRKRKKPSNLLLAKSKVKFNVIDSGAYTFLADKKRLKEADKFMEDYIKWIKTYYDYFNFFVELDIGDIIGQKKVMEWRAWLDKENLMEKCITVYHPEVMTWDDYLETLEASKSRYVAIEGDRPKTRSRLPYNKIIRECINRSIRVHGFAMTKKDVLEKYPFYSVDSSSWKSGYRYGRPYVNSSDAEYLNLSKGKTALKGEAYLREKGKLLNLKSSEAIKFFHKDSQTKVNAYGITAIRSMQRTEQHYTDLWRARGIDWDKIAKV